MQIHIKEAIRTIAVIYFTIALPLAMLHYNNLFTDYQTEVLDIFNSVLKCNKTFKLKSLKTFSGSKRVSIIILTKSR